MPKLGFKGQWVEVARTGKATDSSGTQQNLTPEWIKQVIANYAAGDHEAPAVLGHPDGDSAPAYGWASELRLNGNVLEAKFSDTRDEFEQAVENGEYRKRSASFYLDPPNLRHIGFLGAQPPAIKGLRDIKFADLTGGESFVLEETFNLQETKMKEEDLDNLPASAWEKIKAKLGLTGEKADLKEGGANTIVSFTAADAQGLIDTAVTAVTADFKEKLEAKDKKIEELESKVNGQISGGVRAEIASFVENLDARKGKHFLKRAHIANFLETLAADDAATDDASKVISFSEGEGDDKVEFKSSRLDYMKTLLESIGPMVEFGEKFGNIVATKEADAMVDANRVSEMKKAAGVDVGKGGQD